jgi:hypothetical protein
VVTDPGAFVEALGVPKAAWLYNELLRGVPVMVSRTAFVKARRGETPREATARPLRPPRRRRELVAVLDGIDSAAFTTIDRFGRWPVGDDVWAADAAMLCELVGRPRLLPPRDVMCEPWVLAKIGLTVPQAQGQTLRSYLELRRLRPELPWTPVLQGWEPEDYERHADAYEAHGINLARAPLVGIGSVCKRRGRALRAAPAIFRRVKARGIRGHAFGFAVRGLEDVAGAGLLSFDGGPGIVSGDSQAGSDAARKKGLAAKRGEYVDPALYLLPGHDKPGPGRKKGHQNCGTGCPEWSLLWWQKVVARIAAARAAYEGRIRRMPGYQRPEQLEFWV